jgi:hypothetical protein
MNPQETKPAGAVPAVGERIDLAGFGAWRWWSGGERKDLQTHPIEPDAQGRLRPVQDPAGGAWQLGLEWNEPRDVCQVVVETVSDVPPELLVQYWQKNWPTPAPERLPGARRGWIGRDDPWHGRWVTVQAEKKTSGSTCAFTFDPIDWTELRAAGWEHYDAHTRLGEIEHYLARFRRTLKLRLVCGGDDCPAFAAVHAYAPSAWQEAHLNVQLEDASSAPPDWDGKVEVTNGYLLDLQPLARGARLRLLYTPGDPASADGTVVTLHTPRPFSFLAADAVREPVYVKDFGALVAGMEPATDPAALRAALAEKPRTIYERVEREPEQSLARALAEIPRQDVTIQEPVSRYVVLGVEAGRQEFALRYNGELFGDKRELKLFGRDSARLLWPGAQLHFRFGSGDPPDFRERRGATQQEALEGWLPVFTSRWLDREIETTQTAFAALLDGPMTPPEERSGAEDVVVMMRFIIRNTTHGRKRARLWLAIAPQEHLEARDGLLLALGRVVPAQPVARQWRVDPYEAPYLRAAIDIAGRGTLSAVPFAPEDGGSAAVPSAAAYDIDLEGGEAHSITLAFPFVTLTRPEDWQRALALDYEEKLAGVIAYWRAKIAAGGQVDLPEPLINDFHKAARAHVALSVDKDPASGLTVVPAAAWAYGSCGNEACWQITMLDQAGHHAQARAYLQTFLDTQGWLGLDGNFATREGVLQGMDLDGGRPVQSHFSYNTDHGFIMECLADHYRYTRDWRWLEQNAAKLVAACDFVIREREATKRACADGKPAAEWGLLPAGHLEDNPEWRYWFAVNAHACNGMRLIATVLAEIEHPDAPRLAAEAAAYRADIRQAARRAMVETPVVRLLDGTYIPRIPTRAGLRGREWGWFREAAYGAIHLLECDVFEPGEPEMTWVIQDLEDNLYPTREWGRPVDLDHFWFSHGGITIQPSLTDFAIDYLRRGQVKHGLRSLFNHFAASIYPDVRVFTEHPVVELGHGVGPFYKTSDESKWLVWLRAFLLREEGDALHIAPGAPRAWFAAGQSFGVQRMATFFGPLSYQINAEPGGVTIRLEPPVERPPREILAHVRLPAGQAIQSVLVDGKPHTDFDPQGEVVRLVAPAGPVDIRVEFA